MKLWSGLLFSAVLACSAAHAEKPTEASVKELLVLTNSQQILKSTEAQMDAVMKNMMKAVLKDQTINADQQKILDKFKDKVIDIHKTEMTWEKLEPIFIEIYSNSLSQEEVDGIAAFYRSPAGKAYVSKIPVIVQQSMGAMQKVITPMMDKMMEASKKMAEEFRELEKNK
ncbi:hypothetical protein UNDYM_5543 [Undibacterium sp. YM2]|uniref:DUF2059 domain-containing protein n=1 Tax=Undibacterium sp. YM2 TaxID=2058625 RepID=UPI001331F54D|nr:DUF2059 domain-containing protein [Undibacterium sp. YM2]BBB69796.1 hypothetical protein UNDYM_5543 [Undibacterium sp. YM2]